MIYFKDDLNIWAIMKVHEYDEYLNNRFKVKSLTTSMCIYFLRRYKIYR